MKKKVKEELLALHSFKFSIILKTNFASYNQSTLLQTYTLHSYVQTFIISSKMVISILKRVGQLYLGNATGLSEVVGMKLHT